MRAEDMLKDTEQRERTDRIISSMETLLGRLEAQTQRLELLVDEIAPPGADGQG